MAGIEEAVWFYEQYGIEANPRRSDGDPVMHGDVILELVGGGFQLLETERTGLDSLQRMSGIATLTRELTNKRIPLLVAATRRTH